MIDPMLATGGSAVAALDLLRRAGAGDHPHDLHRRRARGDRAGRAAPSRRRIYTPVVDLGLNAHKYIVPGLGDFGDRFYGTSVNG